MSRIERVALAVALTGLAAGPVAAQTSPPSGPNASQAPTAPVNRWLNRIQLDVINKF